MLKVLCFGNFHFEKDMLALKVGRKLKGKMKGIEFIECGINEEMLFEAKDAVILDVVEGIGRVEFIEPEELKTANTVTAHDIDVSFYVKLLAKTGKKMRILGIPEGMDVETASRGVQALLLPLQRI
jgi:Ni,Fe-hydrogenase maturation factor